MRGFAGDDGARDEARQNMRGYMQERLESYVDSVRGQMSTADQQKLDTLLDQLEKERESLQKAADEVRDTMQELRDLMDEYDAPATDSNRRVKRRYEWDHGHAGAFRHVDRV